MSTSIEIEVESEYCDCCKDCKMNGAAAETAPSKDALLAELKGLLSDTSANGRADRQLKIDELISQIGEMGSD